MDNAKKTVKLNGAINCRDLGGFKTSEGAMVKWNRVYRSDSISNLNNEDLEEFKRRRIYTVVDFREESEIERNPDCLLPGTDYLTCTSGLGDVAGMAGLISGNTSGKSIMVSFYSNTDILVKKYKPFFDKLVDLPDSSALLFHCTAGKDRTGIASALFLYILGVPMDTIIEDYIITNVYRAKANEDLLKMLMAKYKFTEEIAFDVVKVYPEYIEATFEAINRTFGGMVPFFENQLGISEGKREMLKTKFTE